MGDSNERSFLSRIDLSTNRSYGISHNGRSFRRSSSGSNNCLIENSVEEFGNGGDRSTYEREDSEEEMPFSSKHYSKIRWAAAIILLFVLTVERFAFFSLAGNMFLFLNQKPFLWLSFNAMTATYVLGGFTFTFSIFGGYLADSVIGRYYTILVGLILYVVSYVFLTLIASSAIKNQVSNMCLDPTSLKYHTEEMTWINSSTFNSSSNNLQLKLNEERCDWLIYLLLTGVGIAVALVRTNLASFGSEQVRMLGGEAIRTFFSWYYLSINIGGLIAIGGIAYIQQSTHFGFWLGYLIPTCCLGIAILVFAIAKPLFVAQDPIGSLIKNIIYIVKDSIRYRFFEHKEFYNRLQSQNIPPHERPTFLDMASIKYGGKHPEISIKEVRILGNIISVLFALLPFWLLYFQMQTTFLVQGLHMRLGAESNVTSTGENLQTFTIPAAWLTLFNIAFILIFIPIMARFVYPYFDRRGKKIHPITRMGIGMGLATLAMITAGSVETYRLNLIDSSNHTIIQIIGNTTYYAADMWVVWQIPQYSLMGLSEVFASVAGLEFACSFAPQTMRSLIAGIFYFFMGVASFIGMGLLNSFHNVWFYDRDNGNINYSHLDYYFFLLAGIQFASLIVFVILVILGRKRNKLRRRPPPQINQI